MRRGVLAAAALLVVAGGAVAALVAADQDGQTQTCSTGGVRWTVSASWGERYRDPRGVERTRVDVSWSAPGTVLTEWEVRSFNGDGTVTGTLRAQERITETKTVDAPDPAGVMPRVRVRVGVALDGRPDCLLTFHAPTDTPSPTPTSSAGVLFEDDFNGPAGQSFDRSKWQDWSSCTYHASAAYGNIKCGDTETLDGEGHLRVPATPTVGAGMSTATKFGFVYGEASAWIKVPAQDGYWPAFWTLNAEPTCCAAKTLPVGELDVMEQYTTWDDRYHRAFHNWNGADTWHGGIATCGFTDLTARFHKYTVRVEPGKVTYFFNDQQCGRAITKDLGGGKPYAFGPDLMDPNFLILTLAVGGAGGQQNPATEPAVMLVDRVEVRSL